MAMHSFKKSLYLFVFGPILFAVLIILIQSSVLISDTTNLALTTLKNHFKGIGIVHVKSKNLIQKISLEIQYSSQRQNISILKSLFTKKFRNQMTNSADFDDQNIIDTLVKLSDRKTKFQTDQAKENKYFLWNSINQQSNSFNDWSNDEKDYYNSLKYFFQIIPRTYEGKDFYVIDPKTGLMFGHPLRTHIPYYTENQTTYNPLIQDWFKISSDSKHSKIGEYVLNSPFWDEKLYTPFCTQVEDSHKTLKSVICANLNFNKMLNKLKQGMNDTYFQQIYSYLIYPQTRQIIAEISYNKTKVETLDEFEYGDNFEKSQDYENFWQQTQFMNSNNNTVEQDKQRCSLKYTDDVKEIEFVDEDKDHYLLVIRSVLFCEKNEKNLFNLLRVSYIGTAINASLLNNYVLEKTLTLSITQELSLLITIVVICGISLTVVFVGFYFAEQIFEPIKNLTKAILRFAHFKFYQQNQLGLKRLDVESIKVIYKKLQAQNLQENEENLQLQQPVFAYHNLIALINECNKLYEKGQLHESFKLFQRSQQIYNYLNNVEGIIQIKLGKLTEDFCWKERYSYQQKYLSQGISEDELLTDERYYHVLITICRRTFNLIEANLIFIRQLQLGDRLKKVNASKVIDLISDIIDIQEELCTFGKITSVFIYSKIQLSYYHYLQDDMENAQKIYKEAEDAYDGYFPKLNNNQVNSYSLCVLHQALLVQKGLIEEKLGNYQKAAFLFTISLEEVEEYKPDLKEEALMGLSRIFQKHDLQSVDLNVSLQNFQESSKDIFFLIDLSLNRSFLNEVFQTREKIIKYLCDPEDRISQISLSNKLFMNFFKIQSKDIYLRQEGSEMLDHFNSKVSHIQEGLINIFQKIEQKNASYYNNQSEEFYVQFRHRMSQVKPYIQNLKKILFIFTDLSNVLLNQITDQHLQDLSNKYTVVMIDFSLDYVNTDQMFNKIVLSENLNYYHYFNYNNVNNTLIQQWKYIIREPKTEFKFNMEYFQ